MSEQESPTSTATATAGTTATPPITETSQGVPSFTQADLDRIIRERLERERAKYADYDSLKAAQAELESRKAAEMSAEEKRQALIKQLEVQADAAKAESAAVLAKANERLMRAAVMAAASEAGFENPADAYALADRTVLSVGADGEVIGAAEAVQSLAEHRKYLLRKAPPAAPNLNGSAGSGAGSDLLKLTVEQERVAKGMGITLEAYAKRLTEAQSQPRR